MPNSPPEPLDVPAAAARIGIKPRTLYDLVSQRRIRCRRVGVGRGRIVFEPHWIDEYLRSRTVEPIDHEPTGPTLPTKRDTSWQRELDQLRRAAK